MWFRYKRVPKSISSKDPLHNPTQVVPKSRSLKKLRSLVPCTYMKDPPVWKICNRLDGGVRVPKTRWKHHKSKDHIFLHRSYVQLFFSASTKIFCSILKKNWQKLKIVKIQSKIIRWFSTGFWQFSTFVSFFLRIEQKKIFCRSWKNVGHSFDVKNMIFRFMTFSARFGHSNPSIETITYFSSSVFSSWYVTLLMKTPLWPSPKRWSDAYI